MRLLLLYPRLPHPPNKGDKIRTAHQFTWLTDRHDVWCACFVDDPDDWEFVPVCARRCCSFEAVGLPRLVGLAAGARAMCLGRSITEGYYRDSRMSRIIESWSRCAEFDQVLCFGSGMAAYGLRARARRRTLDLCDVDSAKWSEFAAHHVGLRRWLYRREAERLAGLEGELAARFDAVVLISRAEAEDLGVRPSHARIEVVGNGVDIGCGAGCGPPAGEPVLAFVGAMDYWPNVDGVLWFSDCVWSLVRERVPKAEWVIVGRNPTRRVRRLSARPGITVTGLVPEVISYLRGSRVVIAPLRVARGVQNKVLEGMACGRPVVCTSPVARGVAEGKARGLFVADSPADMADVLVRLLIEPGCCEQAGAAARDWVAEHFNWQDRLLKLEQVLATDGPDAPVTVEPLGPLVEAVPIGEPV